MSIQFKYKQKLYYSTNLDSPILIILEDNNLLEDIKEKFDLYDDSKFILCNDDNYHDYDNMNFNFLITDIKKIYKKEKKIPSFLVLKTIEKRKKIFIDNKKLLEHANTYDVISYEIFSDQKQITDILSKESMKTQRLITINKNKIETANRIKGIWRIKTYDEIIISFMAKERIKPIKSDCTLPKILKSSKKSTNVLSFYQGQIIFDPSWETSSLYKKMISWVLSERYYIDIQNLELKKGYSKYKVSVTEIKEDNNLKNVLDNLEKNKNLPGIQYNEFIKRNNDHFTLKTDYGNIELFIVGSKLIQVNNLHSRGDEDLMHSFSKGMSVNIINNINNTHFEQKIKKKQIFHSLIGVILLIVLFYATFNFIFSLDNISYSFDSLFSTESLEMPWIYIMFITFFTSFFMPLLIGLFIDKAVFRNKKTNFKRLLVYFFSSILRRLSVFMTGNYFIGLFVWGWFINRKLDIKTTVLISSISTISILRGVLYAGIGLFFMFIGTLNYFVFYNPVTTKSIITVFVIAWLGFVWEIIHNFWIFFLILSPTIQSIVSNIILKIKFFKKRTRYDFVETNYINLVNLNKGKISMNWKKEKARIYRIVLFIVVPFILEAIETIIYINQVDGIILKETGHFSSNFSVYWDFISLSGLRLAATNIHNFPIINILPGAGVGFSEFGLNTLYESIFLHQHEGENLSEIWGNYSSADLAEMASFLTRLFNQYLLMFLTFVLSLIIISREIFKRKAKNG